MQLRRTINGARVLVTINTDNDAFQGGNREAETARILRELADRIANGRSFPIALMDENGNRVGSAVLR